MNAIITNHAYNKATEILTDNNYHTDTSLLDCYLTFGVVPAVSDECQELWGILEGLKAIDRKNYELGYLTLTDVETRSRLDNRVKAIYKKYTAQEV